jgi:hypothetical protein
MSKTSKPVSEIDRLIALASDEKPQTATISAENGSSAPKLPVEDQKDSRPSMWRLLLQLRVLVPYLAKLLPLLERSLLGTNVTGHLGAPPPAAVDTSNIDRGLAGVGEAQRDLNTAVKAQAAEIYELREQVAILAKLVDRNLLLNEEVASSLNGLRKLATTAIWVIFALLTLLIALAGFAIFGHGIR